MQRYSLFPFPVNIRTVFRYLPCLALFIFSLGVTSSRAQEYTATFEHQAIVVSDLDKSAEFYQEVLGLQEVENKTEKPTRRWFSMGEHLELHLLLEEEMVSVNKYLHMALAVSNFDNFIQNLRDKKIPFYNWEGDPNKIKLRPDGVRQVYLQDPDGYWIEINSNAP
ncbi:VOC family protein [Halalkalibaculum sp. DA384]|uniref:VOC family protein n=1 Tax=Halalkalibaculum sp. DA384 TaxID=3373606 RepID=UPI0037553E5F